MTAPAVTIRWAGPAELRAVAELSARIFDADTEPAESWITRIVEDVAAGGHPQVDPADYAVAVDDATGRIVAAAVLFEQPWRIGGTTLLTGRPELVVTAASHRGGGVMRGVLQLLHRRSTEKGHPAQSITGVPGVYRHLGYEYTHPLGDGRVVRVTRAGSGGTGGLRVAEAQPGETEAITALLGAARPLLTVTTPQSTRYLAFGAQGQNVAGRRGVRTVTIRDESGSLAAVVQFARRADPYPARVLAAAIGPEADPVAVFGAVLAHESVAGEGEVLLALGEAHELYEAAEALGFRSYRHVPDRWYFRIPDVAAFVTALRPELDARLADSIFRRHTGVLTLDLRPTPVHISIARGAVDGIDAGGAAGARLEVRPESVAALLTGATSVRSLVQAGPETRGSPLAVALAGVLFPRLRSRTLALD